MLLFILLNQPSFIAKWVFASYSFIILGSGKAKPSSIQFHSATDKIFPHAGTVLNPKHARSFGRSVSFAALVFYILIVSFHLNWFNRYIMVIQRRQLQRDWITVYLPIQAFIIRAFVRFVWLLEPSIFFVWGCQGMFNSNQLISTQIWDR